MRLKAAAFIGLLVVLATAPALADGAAPDRATCLTAYERGQRLRKDNELLAARERFILCARDPCPATFQPECARWLSELEAETPTVVIDVRKNGAVASEARVFLDGAPFGDKVDGVARAADPGEHELRVVVDGRSLVRRETVLEGVKAQHILVDVETRPSPSFARRSPSPVVLVLAGIGAVALGGFAYFGIHGLSQRGDIERCDPSCNQDLIDGARRSFLIADTSLGIAALSLGAAVWIYLAQSPSGARTAPGRSASLSPLFTW